MIKLSQNHFGSSRFCQKNMLDPKIKNFIDTNEMEIERKVIFNKAENKLVVTVYGDVNWYSSLQDFDDQIANNDFDEMELRINSYGGDAWSGIAIYNRLKALKKPIHGYIDGIAASAASIIIMGADKIYMPETAMMMIHNPWTFVVGDAKYLREIAEKLEQMESQMIGIYHRRTGISKDDIAMMMDKEAEIYGEEAVEKKFADVLLEDEVAEMDDENIESMTQNLPKNVGDVMRFVHSKTPKKQKNDKLDDKKDAA